MGCELEPRVSRSKGLDALADMWASPKWERVRTIWRPGQPRAEAELPLSKPVCKGGAQGTHTSSPPWAGTDRSRAGSDRAH